jgi:hypothetical protein
MKLFSKLRNVFCAVLAASVLWVSPILAANTITETESMIIITDIDSDWTWSTHFPDYAAWGVPVVSIQFKPAAADDQCVILNGSATASEVFNVTAESAYDQKIQYYFGTPLKLFLDYSEGTFTAGSKIIINIGTVQTINKFRN